MPKFENPMPSFEKDDFNYKNQEENPPVEPETSPEEEPGEPMSEEEFEREEEEMDKAVTKQSEELQNEAATKSGSQRFKGVGGFFAKTALAFSALFGGARESQSAEPPKPEEKPAATFKMKEYVYKHIDHGIGTGMGRREDAEGVRAKPEYIMTSFDLGALLSAKKVEDLGGGKFIVYKENKKVEKKFELQIDEECAKRLAEVEGKYAAEANSIPRARTAYEAKHRKAKIDRMRGSMISDKRRIIEERLREIGSSVISKPAEKAPAIKAKPETGDYYKDKDKYDSGVKPAPKPKSKSKSAGSYYEE